MNYCDACSFGAHRDCTDYTEEGDRCACSHVCTSCGIAAPCECDRAWDERGEG